ncbi:MAG: ATP-dependent DNA ligase [Conexivisphaerales archaeon]
MIETAINCCELVSHMEDLPYSELVKCYETMSNTTRRTELTEALVSFYKKTPIKVLKKATYLNQGKLYPDYLGIEIGVGERLTERAISIASGLSVEAVRQLYRKLGDLGSAAQQALESKKQYSLYKETLTISKVYDTLDQIAKTSGEGSVDEKLNLLSGLLSNADPAEAKYIVRTAIGKLRLGIADYTVLDALAIAFAGEKEYREDLERAYNLSSDLGEVAEAIASGGLKAVRSIKITIGRPVRPMLAERLSSAKEIIEKIGGQCSAEYKYDGERMQIHKNDENVSIFSRRLEVITHNYPDAVKLVQSSIKADRAILECEAVAVDLQTGELLPFQQLMHRRRKYGVERAMEDIPVSLFFFDILMVDDKDYTIRPYTERRKKLQEIVEVGERVKVAPNIVTDHPEELERFMQQAIQDGCEGLVVKDLHSSYKAGARAFSWIKLKREYRSELTDTIDLAIVGAFHGRGRRTGVYGAFLLAAYDSEDDTFKTTSKVGTGFSDDDLKTITKELEQYKLPHRSPRVLSEMEADVWFQPALVIEVIASEITLSPIHTAGRGRIRQDSGLALRFPKFTGNIRRDKAAEDATTVNELVEMYNSQLKKVEASPEELQR